MARSKWKFVFFSKKILQKTLSIFFSKSKKKYILKTRSEVIPYSFKNKYVFIHQGLSWTKTFIKPLHVGHKFGEFGLTKKPFYFPLKDKTKTKLNKR